MTRTLWIVEDADRGPQLYTFLVRRNDADGGWERTLTINGWRMFYHDSQIGRGHYYLDEAEALRAYGGKVRQHICWLRREVEQTEARLRVLAHVVTERPEPTE